MLKQAMEYLIGISAPELLDVDGVTYSNKTLQEVKPNQYYPEPLELSTLSSLVDYIKNNIDLGGFDMGKSILHIEDYNRVRLISQLDNRQERNKYVTVKSKTPQFSFNQFIPKENFMIAMQAQFCPTDDRDRILRILSNMTRDDSQQFKDDGITQVVATRKGITLAENEVLPNPVKLAPYRTFVEIDQPVSEFVLRLSEGRGEPEVGLFEADGGKWKLEAIARIKKYLLENVPEKVTIVA